MILKMFHGYFYSIYGRGEAVWDSLLISMLFLSLAGLQIHDTCNMADLTRRHLYHVITATRESVLEPLSGPPSIATTFSRKIKHLKDQKIMRDLGLEREEGDPEDHSLGPPLLGKKKPFHYDQVLKNTMKRDRILRKISWH